jgi:hypothetical protein
MTADLLHPAELLVLLLQVVVQMVAPALHGHQDKGRDTECHIVFVMQELGLSTS